MSYIDKIIIWKGWGFCHQSCIREDHLKNDLQMVKLTTLSDNFCKVRVPVKVEKNVFKNTKEMQKKSPMRPHFFYFDRLPYKYFFLTVCYLFCFFCVSILLQEIGHHQEDNLGSQLVVNTRRELCAGFVNTINFTLFNYTRNKWRWKGKKR